MFNDTVPCMLFCFMCVLLLIQLINMSYFLLQACNKPNQVCPSVNGDFEALYSKLLFSEAGRSCKVGGVCRGVVVFD